MAAKTDYQAGLATLAAGGTTVTFTGGANITAADIQPGDTFKVQNLDAIIATVNSATSVTLTAPWTGAALAAAPYRIRYQPDGSRFTAALRDLVTAIGGGSVAALQALTGAANKLPYFTSASAMALADFTTWARGLLALGTAADARTYMGAQAGASSLTALSGIATASFGIGLLGQASGAATINYITGLTTLPYGRGLLALADGPGTYAYLGNIPAGTVANPSFNWVVANGNHAFNNVQGGSLRTNGSISVCSDDANGPLILGRRTSSGTLIRSYNAGTVGGGN